MLEVIREIPVWRKTNFAISSDLSSHREVSLMENLLCFEGFAALCDKTQLGLCLFWWESFHNIVS